MSTDGLEYEQIGRCREVYTPNLVRPGYTIQCYGRSGHDGSHVADVGRATPLRWLPPARSLAYS